MAIPLMQQEMQSSGAPDTAAIHSFLAALSAFDRDMVGVVEDSGVFVGLTKDDLQSAGAAPACQSPVFIVAHHA